ncbi:hypothetical protein [Clostridium ljungdahlii]|uniref:Putative sensory transducer protein YfmS n=1 Tax=Clostridium ljungdahlii TaxID=1538 RepID=A0A168L9C5_9CLOT|nr:hypothetical protein [Clostridium ljungdahlii]OAA82844.1 putative sensory transducer protein YfmS [Clostridium ljungdahlii]
MEKEEIINAFLKVVPVLKDMLLDDIVVSVADTTKVLYYRPGDTIDIKANVGDKLSPGEPLYEAIKDGKTYSSTISKELNEIRKLAQLSNQSSEKVSQSLSETNKYIRNIFKVISEAQSISEGQAASTQEMNATLEEITTSAQTLTEISKTK